MEIEFVKPFCFYNELEQKVKENPVMKKTERVRERDRERERKREREKEGERERQTQREPRWN